MKILNLLEGKEEDLLLQMDNKFEIGLDEVGRGCIFGPVYSSAVVLSKKKGWKLKELGLDDSKKLSSKKRELLIPHIFNLCEDWSIGQSSVREIEQYGIRYATEISMIRAIHKLKIKPFHILVDGSLPLRLWGGDQKNIVHGESRHPSIAAASIIAKVYRDLLMTRLEMKYKGYNINKNKGYGTEQHFMSIKRFGITKLHRNSFLGRLKLI